MQIEIYADILFFINFLMIFFILWCTNKINKPKIKLSRIIITSILSSFIYCLFILFTKYNKLFNYFIIFILISISILFCFKPLNFKHFLKIFFIINMLSIFIGGLGIFLLYFKSNFYNIMNSKLELNLKSFPFKILIYSIIVSYFLIKFLEKWYKKLILKSQSFYKIKIYKNHKAILLNALLDTGNSLKDPLTKNNVIIAEFLAIKEILPINLKNAFYEKKENDLVNIINNFEDTNFRLIPFTSLGKENGLMIGIKVDKVEIILEKSITLENVLIAICNFKLSKDGTYNSLLSPEMITI